MVSIQSHAITTQLFVIKNTSVLQSELLLIFKEHNIAHYKEPLFYGT